MFRCEARQNREPKDSLHTGWIGYKGIRQNNVVGSVVQYKDAVKLTRLETGKAVMPGKLKAEDYYNGEFDPGSG